MSGLQVKRIFAVVTVISGYILTGHAQTSDPRAARLCTGLGCNAMSRAEFFIKTFASSSGSRALRTSQLEQEEQVRLAFYGMDATRAEIEAGRLSEGEGNFIIDGHERVIRNYIHDKTNEAMVMAAGGQVSSIPAVRKSLSGLLSIARQDALMGHEELAQRAQAQMTQVLTTFSQQFANTCEQQSFPVEVAVELERQNELMGTGISLTHCMNRKYSADLSSQGIDYHFETCSGLAGGGAWELKISGLAVGVGSVEEGSLYWGASSWTADVTWHDSSSGFIGSAAGSLKFTKVEIIDEQEKSVAIPKDAGPNARPNGWPSAPIPEPTPTWHSLTRKIQKIHTTTLDPHKDGYRSRQKWAEAEIKREDDRPCQPRAAPEGS